MKKLMRNMMSLVSESYRIDLYRRKTAIPSEFFNPDFSVEIASTQEDLQSAYALLHDCYVGINIIDPQPSGLRCNIFSFLPTSTVIVAKHRGKVVGTVTTIKDSRAGLPSDKEFPEVNNDLRRQGQSLAEVSALAVLPEYRVNHCVSFLLITYVYNHCRHYFGCDSMLAAVHPRSEDFYKALMGFKRNGKPLQYSTLKGAAAIHIAMDLSEPHLQKLERSFPSPSPLRNFGALLRLTDNRLQYARKLNGLQINPVITPDLLRYFCLEQKEVWSRLDEKDQQMLIQVYSTYFGRASMQEFRRHMAVPTIDKDYRTPVQLTAVIKVGTHTCFGRISDLTAGGCYINSKGLQPSRGDKIEVAFRFGNKDYRLRGQVTWLNQGQSVKHVQHGVGVQFEHQLPTLGEHIRNWIYSVSQPALLGLEGKTTLQLDKQEALFESTDAFSRGVA